MNKEEIESDEKVNGQINCCSDIYFVYIHQLFCVLTNIQKNDEEKYENKDKYNTKNLGWYIDPYNDDEWTPIYILNKNITPWTVWDGIKSFKIDKQKIKTKIIEKVLNIIFFF